MFKETLSLAHFAKHRPGWISLYLWLLKIICLILCLLLLALKNYYRRYLVHNVHQCTTLHHQPESVADAGVTGTGRV